MLTTSREDAHSSKRERARERGTARQGEGARARQEQKRARDPIALKVMKVECQIISNKHLVQPEI